MQIGWKVPKLTSSVASVRYRALLPMLALESVQVRNRMFASGLELNLDGLDALVIVKSFTPDDLFLAQQAASRGVRVVFDLCDNIFIETYGSRAGKVSPAQIFDAIAAQADAVVVTTEPLAAIVRQRVPDARVTVIPDGIETPALLKAMGRLLREAKAFEEGHRARVLRRKLRNLLVRLREEGPGLAVRLAWRVVNRGQRSLRTHWHRWTARQTSASVVVAPAAASAPSAPALPAGEAAPRHAKTILWFGNHGAPHARFGMLDLLEIRGALEAAAQAFDVELVVISNHRDKYEEHIRPLGIPSRYVEWSPAAMGEWLSRTDVVVVPNTLDPFSLCKSANRTVLAVTHGVPVVATATPALEPLAEHLHLGDPLAGLVRYLADPKAGWADAQAAAEKARAVFGQEAIARHWVDLLQAVMQDERRAFVDDAQCIVVVHLVQDLDLAMPIVDAWARNGTKAQVWCSASLLQKSPRVLVALEAAGVSYRVLPDDLPDGSVCFPSGVRALLTVAETNLGPHRFPRKLAELAATRGVTVGTLQHGFENVGLTYDDHVHAIDKITFKADRIYIWGGPQTLHPRVSDSVRSRCISAGCPKPALVAPADLTGLLPAGKRVIGVFENLHWHRYDDAYREAFLDGVRTLAEQFEEVCFLVKPHHAGLWLTRRYDGKRPSAPNLVIADPQLPAWERYTASQLLGLMCAVITTPSTVALDAARRSMPVGVFALGMELTNYEPLPLLRDLDAAAAFVRAALDDSARSELERTSVKFIDRVLVPGDGAQRIALDLAAIAQEADREIA